ncbi:MAG: beta-lactamase family protein [Balneolales bacterium]|nr:beta-lactamase family protein [Balneolales bacterium]
MKYLLLILVAFSLNVHSAFAAPGTKDSLSVRGQFAWEDETITGYPAHVKIVSISNPGAPIIQSVDSLGRFQQTLAFGSYRFSSELNYHWVGEELIRIDEHESALILDVNSNSVREFTILLDTIAWPVTPKKTGILAKPGFINTDAVDSFIQERMEFFEIPGATLSLIKNNEIVYTQHYGVKHTTTGEPVTHETLFEAGSITKLVFTFAVMRIYERGQIDLDKPLHEYMEHPEIDDDRYKLMTARHVLSHQSGMSNWPRRNENGTFGLNFTPGTQYGYSGKAFEYLKEVLEIITSKDIESILREEVLVPLELSDMHFKGNEFIAEFGAHGHRRYVPSEVFLPNRTMVAYTLQSTSEALAGFAIALHQRKGLKASTYEEFFRIHSVRADGTKWGLGVRIEETTSGVSYGHSGSTGRGFISNLVFYDDSGIGFVILTNSQMGGWLSLPMLNEYLVLGSE